MKKLFLALVMALAVLFALQSASVSASGGGNELVCPATSSKPCTVLTATNHAHLRAKTQEYNTPEDGQYWIWGDNIFQVSDTYGFLYQETARDVDVPNTVYIKIGSLTAIPDLGIRLVGDTVSYAVPAYVASGEVGTFLPNHNEQTETLSASSVSVWSGTWGDNSESHCSYSFTIGTMFSACWQIHRVEGTDWLRIDISKYTYTLLRSVAALPESTAVVYDDPDGMIFESGEALTVTKTYIDTSWVSPEYYVDDTDFQLYHTWLNGYEFVRADGSHFTVDANNVYADFPCSETDQCYTTTGRLTKGMTMYVAPGMSGSEYQKGWLSLLASHPASKLTTAEKDIFQQRLNTGQLSVVTGTVKGPVADEEGIPNRYFAITKLNGEDMTIPMGSFVMPPTGTLINVYFYGDISQTPNKYGWPVMAIQDSEDMFWFFNGYAENLPVWEPVLRPQQLNK